MVSLQDLSNLAEIPSTPVAFLELDLEIKACMLTAVVGSKLKTGQATVSLIYGQNPSRTKPLALMIKVDKTPHILFWNFLICKQN